MVPPTSEIWQLHPSASVEQLYRPSWRCSGLGEDEASAVEGGAICTGG